jgi:GT2 family glycosyltransferase
MLASVIVRSHNEAPRLRLTLASLAAQIEPAEIVVVDDGSSDDTPAVVAEWAGQTPVVAVRNASARGGSSASNLGALRASGDILIFLDGDTLAAPDLVARHLDAHRRGDGLIARGETFHLRSARPFADPESGAPFPDQAERVRATPEAERARALITRSAIAADFGAIAARAQPGVYPGTDPRALFALEMDALRAHPDCPALWAAASGSNQSVARAPFLDVGGFDPELSINEHRELALRLCRAGLRMSAADGARTYHMIHRSGWRDPLVERDWEEQFYRAHPISEVPLLSVLWGSLAAGSMRQAARIESIPALFEAARQCDGVVGVDAVREAHFANRLRRAAG